MSKTELIESAKKPPGVSDGAHAEYLERMDVLTGRVDAAMEARSDLAALIGNNPLQVMYDNHRNHAMFVYNVLNTGEHAVLVSILPWVYRSYRSRGFSLDYFPAVLRTWREVIDEVLSETAAREIGEVYRWMIDHHDDVAAASVSEGFFRGSVSPERQSEVKSLVVGLVRGDYGSGVARARELVREVSELPGYYLGGLQPAMYEVGELWEKNEISVAQEHLATAIANRIMSSLYPMVVEGQRICGLTHNAAL